MLDFFRDGGPFMYTILAADVALVIVLLGAVVVAIGARGVAAKVAAGAALVLAALPILLGGIGYAVSVQRVNAAVALASPEYRDQILSAGHREAAYALWFGGGSSALGMLVALVALGIALRPRA